LESNLLNALNLLIEAKIFGALVSFPSAVDFISTSEIEKLLQYLCSRIDSGIPLAVWIYTKIVLSRQVVWPSGKIDPSLDKR